MHRARKPPAPTPEQKAFLDAERTLRDSMHLAVRSYADTVRAGADPRSLPTHRARINDFARRLERLRNENLDVWLDVMAIRPGPHGGPGRHPRPMDGDSLPPPPPGADSSDAPPPPPDAD